MKGVAIDYTIQTQECWIKAWVMVGSQKKESLKCND